MKHLGDVVEYGLGQEQHGFRNGRGTTGFTKSTLTLIFKPGKEVEIVLACDEKRLTLCRREGDENESSREKKERTAKVKTVFI